MSGVVLLQLKPMFFENRDKLLNKLGKIMNIFE